MPRTLSLKKPKASDGVKNQKAITHFFKCLPNSSQNILSDRLETSEEIISSKRKTRSPVSIQSLTSFNNSDNLYSEGKSKKCKTVGTHDNGAIIYDVDGVKLEKGCNVNIKNKSPLSPQNLNCAKDDNFNSAKESQHLTLREKENHVQVITDHKEDPENRDINCPGKNKHKCTKSPKKSPKDKTTQESNNVSLNTTVKALSFSENDVEDLFDEDWNDVDMENIKDSDDLDLSSIQRCTIVSIISYSNRLELSLRNDAKQICTCTVEGVWLNTPLQQGDIVSILASRDTSGHFLVNNHQGLLILHPDHLISSTSVVSGVFCKRKAVLQERWRGIDSANTAMTIGILIHELVQKALTERISSVTELWSLAEKIMIDSIQMLFDAGLTEAETRSNIQMYIGPLAEFMQAYVVGNPSVQNNQKENWRGKIDKVLDIEENVCCPQLGIKGKIDATLQVTKYDNNGPESVIMPLELKSGRASMSAEHRGQLVLYGMMLSLQRGDHPTTALQRGLLLYLKERIELKEVSCGYPERRDLIMLRNELVQHLVSKPSIINTEEIADIEDAPTFFNQSLPEPVYHHNACSKCPYLTICSIHLWHTNGPLVSEKHPLSLLQSEALGHLSPEHIKYFLQWTSLLMLEEKGQMMTSPLHALWTETAAKRAQRGVCAANLRLQSVAIKGDRYLHIFVQNRLAPENMPDTSKGPQEGEFSIVSLDKRPWIAAGVITKANESEIHILLERNLSRRFNKSTIFHIDSYESHATTIQNLTNLGVLMDDRDCATKLRQLIIEKAEATFAEKLSREVGRVGARVMRSLNVEQQRAVLRALAARHYLLLRGLPGTGKTQTITILIEMLVSLKQRVLVTAQTHSAVDNVLSRLPKHMKVMRLGSQSRVADKLHDRCEQSLTANCKSSKELAELYDSMDVVGVTCLGAAHAMLSRTLFDVCIVDEATQVLQCTVLRPLFAAKRFVLVGDPEQLPPVVRSASARRLGMEESLFHRLMREEATCTLRLQYRMNQPLVDVANKVAYKGQLKCANQHVADARLRVDTQRLSQEAFWLSIACSPDSENAAIFLDVQAPAPDKTSDKLFTNAYETCVIIEITNTLIECGVRTSDIGVIAPYRDQVSFLRRELANYMKNILSSHSPPEVSTVDQFQGRDKSVIIYSGTKRFDIDDKRVRDGEILNDQRRLAVSVTRAKHKFIIVGSSDALRRYSALVNLLDACKTVRLELPVVNELYQKYANT